MTNRGAEAGSRSPARTPRGIPLDGFLIAALALAIRLLYVWYASHADPFFAWSRKGFDQYVYQTQAALILDGDRWLSQQPVFFHSPLYSYFLAANFELFGRGRFLPVHLAQALLGALAVSLAYLTARTWLGRPASWFAAGVLALAAPWLYYEQALLQDGLVLCFYSVLLWGLRTGQLGLLARRAEGERRATPYRWPWARLASAGAGVGLATIARGNAAAVMAAMAVWLLFTLRRPGPWPSPRRWGWAATGVFLLGSMVPLSALVTRNHVVTGEWTLGLGNASSMLYLSNAIDADGTPTRSTRFLAARDESRSQGRPVFMRYLREDLRTNPLPILRNLVRKAGFFLQARDLPDNLNFQLGRQILAPVRWTPVQWEWLAPLGLIGIALMFTQARRWSLPLVFALTFYVTLILILPIGRYRAPILLVFALGAGLAAESAAAWLRARRTSRLALVAALWAGLAAALWPWDGAFIRPNDYLNARAAALDAGMPELAAQLIERGQLDHLERLERADRRGDPEAAARAGDAVTEMRPWTPETTLRMARLFARWGDVERARSLLLQLIETHPDQADARALLAQLDGLPPGSAGGPIHTGLDHPR